MRNNHQPDKLPILDPDRELPSPDHKIELPKVKFHIRRQNKFPLAIIGVLTLAALIISQAINISKKENITSQDSQASTSTASLYIEPQDFYVSQGESKLIKLYLNTTNNIQSVNIAMRFDPQAINLTDQISLNANFDNVIELTTREEANQTGQIRIQADISFMSNDTNEIATLPFTANTPETDIRSQISIDFLNTLISDTQSQPINTIGSSTNVLVNSTQTPTDAHSYEYNLCLNKVISLNGQTYWPDACKGAETSSELACAQVLVPLTDEEINMYQNWLSQKSPSIPGCGDRSISKTLCNQPCGINSDCQSGYCYQPIMPTCPPGLGCAQIMPQKVCRNQSCPTGSSCDCNPKILTPTPYFTNPDPNVRYCNYTISPQKTCSYGYNCRALSTLKGGDGICITSTRSPMTCNYSIYPAKTCPTGYICQGTSSLSGADGYCVYNSIPITAPTKIPTRTPTNTPTRTPTRVPTTSSVQPNPNIRYCNNYSACSSGYICQYYSNLKGSDGICITSSRPPMICNYSIYPARTCPTGYECYNYKNLLGADGYCVYTSIPTTVPSGTPYPTRIVIGTTTYPIPSGIPVGRDPTPMPIPIDTPIPYPTPLPPILKLDGDVNSDGCVSQIDLRIIIAYYTGRYDQVVFDVNNDGKFNLSDVIFVFRHLGNGCADEQTSENSMGRQLQILKRVIGL